ncbi:MAG: hypothetical protein RJA51_1370, partial [Actinomycetota bacterium]
MVTMAVAVAVTAAVAAHALAANA